MSISFRKYVDITSGVGGGAGVRLRDLIGRLFTTNPLVPTKSFIEFDTIEDVGSYFGTTSEEYERATFYFGWISKNITRAKKIGFARWADAATAPRIYGDPKTFLVNSFTGIANGAFSLTLGATTHIISSLNFTSAVSLADVAGIIEDGIQAQTGIMWTGASVTYNATRKSFDFVGGSTGANVIDVANAGSGTEIASLIGWLSGAILSDGVALETVVEAITESSDASNNFGSFLFMPDLTIDQIEALSAWNTTQNVLYQYCVPVAPDDAADYYDTLQDYSGIGVTLSTISGEYPEMVPMMILAATDYQKRNAVQNYMFQQFALTPNVTTTPDSNTYDDVRVNYYGRTQTAGQFLDFYQRGVLMGLATAPVDMNTYANEQWLKDAAGAAVMALLLSLSRVSANTQGRSQLIATLQPIVDQGLFNGTISVGKTLTTPQKLFISEQTGDDEAWYQVETIGYWLDCTIRSYVTTDSRIEYEAVYTLIYSKDDAIRKVEGTHELI